MGFSQNNLLFGGLRAGGANPPYICFFTKRFDGINARFT